MKPLAEDADAKTERVLIQSWREASRPRKLEIVEEANRTARARVQQRYPKDNPEVLRRRLADLLFGPELARKAFGPLPSNE
jgi:hypothetical protein